MAQSKEGLLRGRAAALAQQRWVVILTCSQFVL